MSSRITARWTWSVFGFGCFLLLCLASSSFQIDPSKRPLQSISSAARREIASLPLSSRPVEGRLTGGFAYARYGRFELAPSLLTRLGSLQEKLKEGSGLQRSPRALADLGVLKLFAGKPGEAVDLLEEAVAREPENASFLNDLGVAYLARAPARDETELRDFGAALSRFDEALEIDPELREALFNKALALERLYLPESARAAWQEVLRLDESSGWTAEAQGRLAALNRKSGEQLWEESRQVLDSLASFDDTRARSIVRRFTEPAVAYAEKELLAEWAAAEEESREEEAGQRLWLSRVIGEEAAARTGDRLVLESVHAIDAARSGRAGPKIQALIEGHKAYGQGLRRAAGDQPEAAAVLFRTAEDAFVKGGSPYRELARLQLAIARYIRQEYSGALAMLRPEEVSTAYPLVRARIYWMIGLCRGRQGEPMATVRAYRQALLLFQAAKQSGGVASIRFHLAEIYRHLGESREAWRQRRLALSERDKILAVGTRYSLLDEVANAFLKLGQPRTSIYFREEVIRLAEEDGTATTLTYALSRWAETYAQLGGSRSRPDLRQAREACRQIEDPELREEQSAKLKILEAEALLPENPEAALQLLDEAFEFFHVKESRYLLTSIHLARARIYQSQNDGGAARAELLEAVETYEGQSRNLENEALRLAHFAQARNAFDGLIRIEIEDGRYASALALSERMRARELLERIAVQRERVPAAPPAGSPLAAQVPSGILILEYALLEDHLVTWAIRSGRIEAHVAPVGREQVDLAVRQALRAIGRGAGEKEELARLREILVSPLEELLRPGDLLVFVPDGSLYAVPFSALVDEGNGRYLAEDHPVVVSPSAYLFLDASRRYAALHEASAGALILGGPELDPERFPDLEDLPGARAEAEEIGRLYGTRAWLGAQVTEELLASEAGRHAVVHVGSHALANPEDPALSRLILAARGDQDGVLTARELARIHYDRTRVFVLASCRSGAGEVDAVEGRVSLGWHLLAAGVPSVVLSHWDVGDEAARLISVELHRGLAAGLDPASALRRAQVKQMRDREGNVAPVNAWAGFFVLGGGGRPGS